MTERAQNDKFSHEAVRYTHPSTDPETTCGDCAHLIRAIMLRCEVTKNPIRQEDWCERWKSRAKVSGREAEN